MGGFANLRCVTFGAATVRTSSSPCKVVADAFEKPLTAPEERRHDADFHLVHEVGREILDTVVTWTLTPTPSGGPRLELEHSGFVPSNAFAFDGASKGWQRMISEGLTKVLARTT